MLEFKKGVDILSAVGGVTTIGEAKSLFERRLDGEHFNRLATIKNEEALLKVANAIAMCDPDQVYVHTGSEEDRANVRRMSLEKGEEKKLAMPNHTIHFDLPEDQGRMVDQTFYIVNEDEKVSSLAKKELRDVSHAYMRDNMRGIMRGKTMFIGFYSRGPVGAKASIPAIEISSSTYVMHSAELLYRNCFADFDAEVARLKTQSDATAALQAGRADAQCLVLILALTLKAKNAAIGDVVIPTPVDFTTSNAGFRREEDQSWRTFVDDWISKHRENGFIKAAIVRNMELVGVKESDFPPGFEI